MMRTWRLIRGNWRQLYRHHGGAAAVARCWRGDWKLRHSRFGGGDHPEPAPVDCVTFSVIPSLTALWARLIERAIPAPKRILIGDCSGGLQRALKPKPREGLTILPLLNRHHGEKLDLFLERVCSAELVVVSDDDVFWLDQEPWNWALEQLESDPKVAVVSLLPRDYVSSVLQGKVDQAMGSHCLVLRRSIWLEQRLSFQKLQPPAAEGYDWFYDTADLAQVELLARGYRVVIAPPQVDAHLAAFEAASAWMLKLRKHDRRGLEAAIAGIPLRREKALRAVLVGRALAGLSTGAAERGLPDPSDLDRVEGQLHETMERESIERVEAEVAAVVGRVRRRLNPEAALAQAPVAAPGRIQAASR